MKKRTFKLTTLGLIMFSSCFVACKKNDVTANKPNNTIKTSNKRVVNGFDFEQFGISHNARLDYLAANRDLPNMTAQDKLNYLNGYSDEAFGQTIVSWTTFSPKLDFINSFSESVMNSEDAAQTLLVDQGKIPAEMNDFVVRLNSIFYNAYNRANGTSVSVDEFNSKIVDLENWVIANYPIQIDGTECNAGANMLASCAIARNSFSYWTNADNDVNNPWNYRFNPASGAQYTLIGRVWHRIKVAAADTYGFVVEPWQGQGGGLSTWNYNDAVVDATIESAGVN